MPIQRNAQAASAAMRCIAPPEKRLASLRAFRAGGVVPCSLPPAFNTRCQEGHAGPPPRSCPHRVLDQLALQRAAMHAQGARGGRDIAVVLKEDALNVLPRQTLDREQVLDRRYRLVSLPTPECRLDRVGIHRL